MARINAVERESGCVRVSEKAQKKNVCYVCVCGGGAVYGVSRAKKGWFCVMKNYRTQI